MSDTGWKSPTTYDVVESGWSNASAALSSNDTYTYKATLDENVTIYISKDGGTNKYSKWGTFTSASDETLTYGGAGELWSTTWDKDSFSNVNFVLFLGTEGAYGTVYEGYGSFGFDIPDGATITGIEVSVEGYISVGSSSVNSVDHVQAKVYYTETVVTPIVGNKYAIPPFKKT